MAVVEVVPVKLDPLGQSLEDVGTYTRIDPPDGGTFPYKKNQLLVIGEVTTSSTVVIKVHPTTRYSEKDVTMDDVVIPLTAGEVFLYPITYIFKDPSDGKVLVTTDETLGLAVFEP